MQLGIIQGRLVPKLGERYQAFPVNYWEAEFHIARELGFTDIEFILDEGTEDQNPLMSANGLAHLKSVIETTGVGVKAICADYFMEAPFHSDHQTKSESVLKTLIESAGELGVKDIVIPCVDQSTLKGEEDQARVIDSVSKHLDLAREKGVLINFETDLAPKPFRDFVDKFDSPTVKVNYDIGNSASLSYNPEEEFEAYGDLISDLHIKDRPAGGASVMLGTGGADFDLVFGLLKKHSFKGHITMQASRAENYVEEIQRVKTQKEFSEKYIQKYLG